jgi:hypothetical protein
MIIDRLNHLPLDVETVALGIEKELQAHGDDTQLFEGGWFTRISTMFEGRAVNEREFAKKLWLIIRGSVEASVTGRLVVVAFPKITSPSVDIGYDGLTLINAADLDAWQTVAADYQIAPRWNPRIGVVEKGDPKIFGSFLPEVWAVCQCIGTEQSAKNDAFERIRTLVALLFALSYSAHPMLLTKTADEAPRGYTQFASLNSTAGFAQTCGRAPELVPVTFARMDLSPVLLSRVQSWYRGRDEAPAEMKRRAVVASQFLHFGFVADGLEQFIHFFIVLDALFGVRGRVERSIVAGVEQSFDDRTWTSRAGKLIELRNELMHGGSSTIETCPSYSGYVRCYRSHPLRDIATAATVSASRFFERSHTSGHST